MSASISQLWDGSTSKPQTVDYQTDGSARFVSPLGRKYTVSAMPDAIGLSETPATTVRDAVDTYNTLAAKTFVATNNVNLSDAGRRNALFEPQKIALLTFSALAADLKKYRLATDKREAQLFALPPLNLALAGPAIAEWEIRSWYAAQPPQAQADIVTQACQTTEGEAVIAALLRGPGAGMNPAIKGIRESWQDVRRRSNATEAEAIDAQRAAADWAHEQLAMIVAMGLQLTTIWGKVDVIKLLLQPGAGSGLDYEIFGFTDKDVRQAQQSLQFQSAAV